MELNEFINTGISEGWVRDTGTFDEVFIDGGNRKCQKYDVRIDKLHYNVQNGRIATFVSRYKAEHGELPSDIVRMTSAGFAATGTEPYPASRDRVAAS